tara:strand:- start:2311 stop:2601 length:291 start_codon:yes stop_codon:yes gene_type:complete
MSVQRISQRVTQTSTGDIEAVTTTAPLEGGGTTGALALTFSPNAAPAGTLVGADYIVFSDTNDSNLAKKGLVSDITALAAVDVSSATLLIAGQVFS